ncbi:Hypothetical predicted protein [Mytilus galloprovincialis]|uniref:Uncharacterized protein n=1 Tax=Mytilus galloprovincialis TaxID=29158 RepID=A0A8B6HBS0_MYTGA|nr:Hypothetical predicted protein [Mytilus galloprovincialis]
MQKQAAAEEFSREPPNRNASAIHISDFRDDCNIDAINKRGNLKSVLPASESNTFSVNSEAAEEFPREPSDRNASAIHTSVFRKDCYIDPNKWRNSQSVLPVFRSNTFSVKSEAAEEFPREPSYRNASAIHISDFCTDCAINPNKWRNSPSVLPVFRSNTLLVKSATAEEFAREPVDRNATVKHISDSRKNYHIDQINKCRSLKSILPASGSNTFSVNSAISREMGMEGILKRKISKLKGYQDQWFILTEDAFMKQYEHSSPDVAYDEDEDDVFTNKSNQKAKEDNPEPKLTTRKLFGDTFKSKDAFPKQNNDPRKSEETVNDPLKESAADIKKKFKEMTIVDREKRHLMVAAIDIGSTFSGWAYSLNNPPENNVMGIGQTRVGSLKVPTVLLLDHDREFVAFGFRAEFIYSELLQNNPDEAHTCYYFSRFKMQLYNNMNLKKSMTIKDITGKKEMKAVDVFAYCIENIKDSMFRKAEEEVTDLLEYDIKWVLTVPAVWNEAARECMLEAAEKAGIDQEKLTLALEPEAAALYCKYSEIQKRTTGKNSKLGSFDTGAKFVVVDLGGGTVAITLNEVLASDQLKVIHSAYCGPWGGNIINERIWKLLQGVFGEKTVTKFIAENRVDYLELARTVELKKRTVKSNNKVSIEIPRSLMIEAIKTNPDIIAEEFKKQVKLVTNKLQVLPGVLPQIFKEGIDTVSKYVQNLLDQPESKGVSTILLVGGYAACDLLKDAMKTNFKNLTVICPLDSDVVVLKGAVIMGHMETPLVGRISKCH